MKQKKNSFCCFNIEEKEEEEGPLHTHTHCHTLSHTLLQFGGIRGEQTTAGTDRTGAVEEEDRCDDDGKICERR